MNERIIMINEQAIEYAHAQLNDIAVENKGGIMYNYNDLYTEKFAELIVRECAEVAHCNFHVDGLTLGGIMKKHFGVKE
jgi:hypothetical protein